MFTQGELQILAEAMTLMIRDEMSKPSSPDASRLGALNDLADKVVSMQEANQDEDEGE